MNPPSKEKKTLTVRAVPEHIKKLQELKLSLKEPEKEVKEEKAKPIYQKEAFTKAMDWLYKTFPKCFFQREQKPLKVSIFDDILAYVDARKDQEEDLPSKRGLRMALSTYARNRFYLKACVANAPRIDLDGNEVSIVTESEAEYAKTMFNKYNKVFKDKNKAKKKRPFQQSTGSKPAGQYKRPFDKNA